MKNILLIISIILGSNYEAYTQEFNADPNGDQMILSIRGKKITGPIGNPNGNTYLILQRSDGDDNAFLQFNANPNDNNLNPVNRWEIGLRGEDELGVFRTEGSTTGAAMKFNTSAALPRVAFGGNQFLAKVTVENASYGQKGIHVSSSGTGIYAESTSSAAGAAGPGIYGKSQVKDGVYGESQDGVGVHGISTGTIDQEQAGVLGESTFVNHYGVWGKNNAGIGVRGEGGEGYYGVYGSAGFIGVYGATDSGSQTSRGVLGSATNGIGVRGHSTNYYGIHGETENANSYAGYFEGDIYCTGSYYGSDLKLKKNISRLNNALHIIDQLKPVSYEFKSEAYAGLRLPEGTHCGLVAQEVEKIMPELVKETKHLDINKDNEDINFKALNYIELIPILIAAIQEQGEIIKSLQEMMNK